MARGKNKAIAERRNEAMAEIGSIESQRLVIRNQQNKIEELRALIKTSGAVDKVENLIEKLTNDSLTAIEDPSIHPSSREFLTYIALSAVKRSA